MWLQQLKATAEQQGNKHKHACPTAGRAMQHSGGRTSAGFLDSCCSATGTPSFSWIASFRAARLALPSTSMRSRPSLRGKQQRAVGRLRWRQVAAAADGSRDRAALTWISTG